MSNCNNENETNTNAPSRTAPKEPEAYAAWRNAIIEEIWPGQDRLMTITTEVSRDQIAGLRRLEIDMEEVLCQLRLIAPLSRVDPRAPSIAASIICLAEEILDVVDDHFVRKCLIARIARDDEEQREKFRKWGEELEAKRALARHCESLGQQTTGLVDDGASLIREQEPDGIGELVGLAATVLDGDRQDEGGNGNGAGISHAHNLTESGDEDKEGEQ